MWTVGKPAPQQATAPHSNVTPIRRTDSNLRFAERYGRAARGGN